MKYLYLHLSQWDVVRDHRYREPAYWWFKCQLIEEGMASVKIQASGNKTGTLPNIHVKKNALPYLLSII